MIVVLSSLYNSSLVTSRFSSPLVIGSLTLEWIYVTPSSNLNTRIYVRFGCRSNLNIRLNAAIHLSQTCNLGFKPISTINTPTRRLNVKWDLTILNNVLPFKSTRTGVPVSSKLKYAIESPSFNDKDAVQQLIGHHSSLQGWTRL